MAVESDAPVSWLKLRFTCDAATAARLAEHLEASGALAVSLDPAGDDAIYEPEPGTTPLWRSTAVSGLYAGDRDPGAIIAALAERLAPRPLPAHRLEVLADREWVRTHRDAFAPVCFGDRVWIVPSWSEPPTLAPGQVMVRMDPGLAFGTGGHATTAMCLAWLAGETLADREVVDYGCGSGILAIAAARLGARRVWAVDNDPQALVATRDNAEANGVADRITVRDAADLPALTAQALVSNILANTLNALAGTLGTLLSPGGRIALAGILKEQSPRVIAGFAPWCALGPAAELDGWVLLAGTRRETGA